MRETERRLAGDLLADALGGRLERRGARAAACARSGSATRPRCWSSSSTTRRPPRRTLEAALADAGVPALVATSAAAGQAAALRRRRRRRRATRSAPRAARARR